MAGKIDPRVLALLEQAEPYALRRHKSRRQWALSVPMEETQLTAAFNDRAGVSPARLLDLIERAGLQLRISEPTSEQPSLAGTLTTGGWIENPVAGLLPSYLLVNAVFHTAHPGDRLLIVPARFVTDTWVLVELEGGRMRVLRCGHRGKKKILESDGGEVTFFDEKVHLIHGCVAFRQEPFVGRRK